MSSDQINMLPTDKIAVENEDLQIVDKVFEKNSSKMGRIASEFKDSLIAGVLFALLSFPQVDSLIQRFVPLVNNSPILLLIFKVVIFVISFFVIKNFAFAKKKK